MRAAPRHAAPQGPTSRGHLITGREEPRPSPRASEVLALSPRPLPYSQRRAAFELGATWQAAASPACRAAGWPYWQSDPAATLNDRDNLTPLRGRRWRREHTTPSPAEPIPAPRQREAAYGRLARARRPRGTPRGGSDQAQSPATRRDAALRHRGRHPPSAEHRRAAPSQGSNPTPTGLTMAPYSRPVGRSSSDTT